MKKEQVRYILEKFDDYHVKEMRSETIKYEIEEFLEKFDLESVNSEELIDIQKKYKNALSALLSIYDSLKLNDKNQLKNDETLTEIMFRKLKAYNLDLNKELGFTHLKPVEKEKNNDKH